MTRTTQSISPLRQRMIDDMALRKLSPKTQSGYIRVVRNFAHFLGHSPDTATAEDLRRYQLHLVSHGISSVSLNATITGLRFFRLLSAKKPSVNGKAKRGRVKARRQRKTADPFGVGILARVDFLRRGWAPLGAII